MTNAQSPKTFYWALGASFVSHGALALLAALAFFFNHEEKPTAPLGIEIMWGMGGTATLPQQQIEIPVAPKRATKTAAQKAEQKKSVVLPGDVAVDVAVKEQKIADTAATAAPSAEVSAQVSAESEPALDSRGRIAGNSSSGALHGQAGVTSGAVVSARERYNYELSQYLSRIKDYPMIARRMGHEGTLVVRMKILADGAFTEITIEEEAPFETLNKAAVASISRVGRFKSLPVELQDMGAIEVSVPIEYILPL